jgi:hypothetical protein
VGAGGDQHAPRLDGGGVPAFLEQDDRCPGDRDRARPQEHARARALGGVDQLATAAVVGAELARIRDPEPGARLLEDLAAESRPLVDERDRQSDRGRLDGGGEPRRAAADDEEIGSAALDQAQRGIGGSGAPIVAL